MIRVSPTTPIPIAADIPGLKVISIDEGDRVEFVMFIKRGTVLFVLVAVGVEERVATMLKEDTELEVTEGEEEEDPVAVTEGEEEGDPVAVTEGDEVGITVTEADEEAEGDAEVDTDPVTDGEVDDDIVIRGETVGVIVALAVVADPRAQQRVTEDEKVLPSINWHP